VEDSDIQDFRPRAYPPSILIGGAGLVVVLTGIVAAVLMVSAASVRVPPLSPPARISPAAPVAVTVPAQAEEPAPQNNLDIVVAHLSPQLPAIDRLLQAP